jgi:hypothetical protein
MVHGRNIARSLEEKAMSDCIRGTGSDNGKGYLIRRNPELRKNEYCHRTAYRNAYGEIPKGAVVRHSCDNRWCVNPDHLSIGSNKDNTSDMYKRKREGCSKISFTDAESIRASDKSPAELMAAYGLSKSQIYKIIGGKSWPALA